MGKKAILVVSIGTSQIEALEHTTLRFAEEIQGHFPEYACYIAFSSIYILKKMKSVLANASEEFQKAQQNKYLSIEEAMEQMIADGIEEVFVQPTHLLRGVETDKMKEQLQSYQTQISNIQIAEPLLVAKEDHMQTLQAILEEVSLEEEEALLLVGHGTTHSANNTYQNLEYTAYVQGYRNVFVGTMEGGKSQRMTLRKLSASGYKKVRLMPLLFVAGYHANKDILMGENSWKNILEEAGFQVCPVMKGLGEYKGIRDIFLRHLETKTRES